MFDDSASPSKSNRPGHLGVFCLASTSRRTLFVRMEVQQVDTLRGWRLNWCCPQTERARVAANLLFVVDLSQLWCEDAEVSVASFSALTSQVALQFCTKTGIAKHKMHRCTLISTLTPTQR